MVVERVVLKPQRHGGLEDLVHCSFCRKSSALASPKSWMEQPRAPWSPLLSVSFVRLILTPSPSKPRLHVGRFCDSAKRCEASTALLHAVVESHCLYARRLRSKLHITSSFLSHRNPLLSDWTTSLPFARFSLGARGSVGPCRSPGSGRTMAVFVKQNGHLVAD